MASENIFPPNGRHQGLVELIGNGLREIFPRCFLVVVLDLDPDQVLAGLAANKRVHGLSFRLSALTRIVAAVVLETHIRLAFAFPNISLESKGTS
jgi:hypothetical protein